MVCIMRGAVRVQSSRTSWELSGTKTEVDYVCLEQVGMSCHESVVVVAEAGDTVEAKSRNRGGRNKF